MSKYVSLTNLNPNTFPGGKQNVLPIVVLSFAIAIGFMVPLASLSSDE